MVVKQRNIRNKPQSMAESNPNPFFRSSENTISEASEQQIVYSQVQPPNPPSMAGFYTVVISLFVFFTIAMIGMMWFVAHQINSDRSQQITQDKNEELQSSTPSSFKRETEIVEHEPHRFQTESKDSLASNKESKVASDSNNEKNNSIFKKLNTESGSCVVLIEGRSKNEAWRGTGFIIYRDDGPDGHSLILTNSHVAFPEDGSECVLFVKCKSGEIAKAIPVGQALEADLAVLAIPNMTDMEPIWKLRSSQYVEEGDCVYTVGHPLGVFDFTVSEGKLTKKRDSMGDATLQHSAAISHGNSGGPLLDSEGNIIGINTLGFDAGNSLYFAIPIEFLHKEGAWEWISGFAATIRKIQIEGE